MVAALVLGHQLRARPRQGHARARARRHRGRRADRRSSIRQRRARFPLYDLDIASRRIFWVAALAGIIVFGSLMGAMFVGQQFLQNVLAYSPLEAGRRDPARGGVHGARGATVGEAHRVARRAVHAAVRLRLLPARVPDHAAALGGRQRLLAGRTRLRLHRARRRPRGHARLALTDRVRARAACGDGVGDRRSPARPRRGDHAVDPRRAARRRVRGRVHRADHGVAERRPGQHAASRAQLTKSFSSAANTASQYPQYAKQITNAAKTSFVDGAELGVHRRDRRDPARRDAWCSSCSRATTARTSSSPSTTPRTPARRPQSPHPGDLARAANSVRVRPQWPGSATPTSRRSGGPPTSRCSSWPGSLALLTGMWAQTQSSVNVNLFNTLNDLVGNMVGLAEGVYALGSIWAALVVTLVLLATRQVPRRVARRARRRGGVGHRRGTERAPRAPTTSRASGSTCGSATARCSRSSTWRSSPRSRSGSRPTSCARCGGSSGSSSCWCARRRCTSGPGSRPTCSAASSSVSRWRRWSGSPSGRRAVNRRSPR